MLPKVQQECKATKSRGLSCKIQERTVAYQWSTITAKSGWEKQEDKRDPFQDEHYMKTQTRCKHTQPGKLVKYDIPTVKKVGAWVAIL